MNSQKTYIKYGRELDLFFGKLVGMGTFFAMLVAVVQIINLFLHGITNHHLLMLVAAMFSVVILLKYASLAIKEAETGIAERKFSSLLIGVGAFFPYLFGTYLCAYEGIWKLLSLFGQFSFGGVFSAFFYLIAGFKIVSCVYVISEFFRSVDEGRVVIEKVWILSQRAQ